MSAFKFTVLILMIKFITSNGEKTSECGLVVQATDTQLDAQSCTAEYNKEDCSQFVQTFNQSFLPDEFQNQYSISKPMNLKLSPLRFYHEGPKMWVPAIDLAWSSPLDGVSRKELNGFLMSVDYHGGSDGSLCRLFQLSESTPVPQELMFKYTFKTFRPNVHVQIKLYSMPAPTEKDHMKPESFEEAFMVTGPMRGSSSNPASYYPSLVLQPRDGGIELVIDRSPPEFNFTRYLVKIFKRSYSEGNFYKSVTVEAAVETNLEKTETFFIKVNETDEYKLGVRPEDTFRLQEGKCLCWRNETLSGDKIARSCENTCTQVDSTWIKVTVTPTVTDPTTTTIETPPADNGTRPSPSAWPSQGATDDDNKVIIIVFLSVFIPLCIIALVVLALWCRRGRPNVKEICKRSNEVLQSHSVPSPILQEDRDSTNRVVLSEKTVLLLYAKDNKAHEHLMDCWANFLQIHCRCKVIYPPWEDIHKDGTLTWLLASMDRANFILVVGSEAGETLIEAHMRKQMYRSYKTGPDGDLFTLGIKHLLAQGIDSKTWMKLVLVTFDTESWCHRFIITPSVYRLPQALPLLLHNIHGFSSREADGLSHNLPLQVENLKSLDQGLELLSAIEAAQKYQKEHPDWLMDQLGTPTPIFKQTVSNTNSAGDSGCGSLLIDRMISVSSQDVSFTDTSGSPLSLLDEPVFDRHQRMYPRFSSTRSQPCSSTLVKNDLQGMENPQTRFSAPPREVSSPPKEEEVLSVVTVQEECFGAPREASVCPTIASGLTASPFQVLPPESASTFQEDSVSAALHQINARTEARNGVSSQEPSSPDSDFDAEHPPYMNSRVIPPDALSDIPSESLSIGFTEINRESDAAFCFKDRQDMCLDHIDLNVEDSKELDTVSI